MTVDSNYLNAEPKICQSRAPKFAFTIARNNSLNVNKSNKSYAYIQMIDHLCIFIIVAPISNNAVESTFNLL